MPNNWLIYAIASGGCAALNGVFAKLTTTTLTTSWASALSRVLNLEQEPNPLVDLLVRGLFLVLNLGFNTAMWTLFTRALTLSASTVRVSILNTAANFLVTAVLGALVFGERLPPLWWAGAGMLVAGSVIIGGRKEEEGGREGEAKEREKGAEDGSSSSSSITISPTTGKESETLRRRGQVQMQ